MFGFFAGSLNFFGWIFDLASVNQILANVTVQMYAVFHPDLVITPWMVYIAYLIITWAGCAFVIFCNRLIPAVQKAGLFLVIIGGLVTIIVVAAMPKQHASSSFVWTDWNNQTGWTSGVAFLTGVLNGAFTIGTPDSITHLAEELPNPRKDLPRAIAAQIILGTVCMLPNIQKNLDLLTVVTQTPSVTPSQSSMQSPISTPSSVATVPSLSQRSTLKLQATKALPSACSSSSSCPWWYA